MLHSSTTREQYQKIGEDELSILVIGAGIAGISAAQMLRKDGKHPVLIERNTGNIHPGYMLALMPMVDALLDDLEVRDQYRQRSTPLARYGLHGHTGKLIREDPMNTILDRFGDYRGIARGELLEVLTSDGCDVAFDTTVIAIGESPEKTEVILKTGSDNYLLEFDMIIIADGIHSATRELVLYPESINIVDTHWGGWVVWAPEDENMDLGEELWGAGFFFGVYPVKNALGVFLGGNQKDTQAGPDAFVKAIRKKLNTINPRIENCLQAVTRATDPFYWPLTDCRCHEWVLGHSILLGDAAAGFLPTAGIGAGMAMESAWMLTRMLRHADKDNIPSLLKAYETAQKPRVESAQDNSRGLAWLMFRKSSLLASLRDWAMRFVSVEMALKPIQKLIATQPDPDSIVKKWFNSKPKN